MHVWALVLHAAARQARPACPHTPLHTANRPPHVRADARGGLQYRVSIDVGQRPPKGSLARKRGIAGVQSYSLVGEAGEGEGEQHVWGNVQVNGGARVDACVRVLCVYVRACVCHLPA